MEPMRLKIEVNTYEHFSEMGYVSSPFAVENAWFSGCASIKTYNLEELLGTGSMIKWGKIVSGISDKDLAILSVGLTNKGRHFLLAGLADERLPEVVEISKHIENDINDAEAVAQMIMWKWDKF